MIKVYPLRVRKGSFINYTYLVVNEWTNESIIIDPAWELDTITTYLLKTNSHLKGILLTHHHRDHTLLAPVLASRFGVPVFMGMIEKEFYNFNCLNLEVVSSDLLFSIGGFGIFPH
ncbi:MAG TPA: MBL fold metallo-hydrolase, partial [Chitinophagaceae bacterium]|nr:MBL fold metallo-hydrolase [Chitinophagaceae bacterium]